MKEGTNKRINWIDCAKTMAMVAVITDHCYALLYSNSSIAQASYYSVSLFVLLSGISASLSFDRISGAGLHGTYQKIKKIFIPYAVATLIVTCLNNRFFDLKTYLSHLIHFSATGPYYYFVFLFQLIFISPFLIQWCRFCQKQKREFFWHIGTIIVLCFAAAAAINYTFILDVHGGGKYLWGGTYCLLYYIGILLQEKRCFAGSKKIRLMIMTVSLPMWFLWWNGMCKGTLPFDSWMEVWWGEGFNPPSVKFMVFSIITLFFCYAFFSLLDEIKEIRLIGWCMSGLTWIGRNTLYIFMYHILVRDMELYICSKLGIEVKGRLIAIFLFAGVLIIPVIGKEVVVRILKKLNRYYKNSTSTI